MNIGQLYHIDPTDIEKLIDVCNRFDNACQECVDNGNNKDYQPSEEFGFTGEALTKFVSANPNFDYQRLLEKKQADIISPFYSEVQRNQDFNRKAELKERMRLNKRYNENHYY